jgi:hypothetical protein
MNAMPDIRHKCPDEDPMGIVISSGSRSESAPRFAAYVWGQEAEVSAPALTEPRAA